MSPNFITKALIMKKGEQVLVGVVHFIHLSKNTWFWGTVLEN